MVSKLFLSALTAAAIVSAQGNRCSQSTITINSNADASNLANCRTLDGNVVVGTQTDDRIRIDGPTSITGDLTVLNNGAIVSLQSNSIRTIGGMFRLQNLTLLSSLSFTALQEAKEIHWQSLPALEKLTFGTPGVTKAPKIEISDTFLNSLDGLDVVSVDFMDINNNKRLTSYTSKLGNLTQELRINANGRNLKIDMPNLLWAANLTVANVSSFTVPQLSSVNGSIRFDSNFLTDFSALNLTEVGGDVAFIGNADLTNISFPELTVIGGSLSVMNNTKLQRIESLPKLRTVGGAVKLRGNFSAVALPSLNDVKGAFDVVSTNDITKSCDVFQKLSRNGGGGQIQGLYSCTGNVARANDDTSPAGSGSSGGSGSGGGNSAAGVTINVALLALSLVGGAVALL